MNVRLGIYTETTKEFKGWTRVRFLLISVDMTFRGLPHYKQLNFGGGSDWFGANVVALLGITQAGDKNNVALKS
jgi:hypothetical protein